MTGQPNANTTTKSDMTTGPVTAGRLGKNTVTTANSVAVTTVVEAEIVLRTLLSCHARDDVPGSKTHARRNLTGTVIVVA